MPLPARILINDLRSRRSFIPSAVDRHDEPNAWVWESQAGESAFDVCKEVIGVLDAY